MHAVRRTLLPLATLAVATVFLAGCASDGQYVRSSPRVEKDRDYIVAVERAARAKGVQVVWVNPPPELGKNYLRKGERKDD